MADLPPMNQLPAPTPDVWGLYDKNLKPAFDIDTCITVDYRGKTRVSQFPVEKGSFVDYNKVQEPFEAKLRLSVGSDSARMTKFLTALEYYKNSTDLLRVVTPEQTYVDATLHGYDYKREREQGRGMIVADIQLTEVRQVTPQYATVKLPVSKVKKPDKGAAGKKDNGKQQPVTPRPDFHNAQFDYLLDTLGGEKLPTTTAPSLRIF